MELKPLSLLISFRRNFVKQYKIDNDAQILYWVLWDKWNYLRRPATFNLDNNTLIAEANLKNYSRLNDKRKKLIEAGLINYLPSKTRGKASAYSLIKNYDEDNIPNLNQNLKPNLIQNPNTNLKPNLNERQELNNDAPSYDLSIKSQNLTQNLNSNLNTNPIQNLKPNPHKSNRDIENNIYIYLISRAKKLLEWYRNNIAIDISQSAMQIIGNCVELYGEEQTLEAMQTTLEKQDALKDVAFMRYTRVILQNWQAYGKSQPKPRVKPQFQPQQENRAMAGLAAIIQEGEST